MSGKGTRYVSIFVIANIIAVFFLTCPVIAQQNQTANKTETNRDFRATPRRDAPESVKKEKKYPVMVIHKDTDDLGRRLTFNLREVFNKSSIFRLSGYNEQKIQVILSTRQEFEGRPNISSIYTIIWLFSSGEGMLNHYLDSETGFIDFRTVEDLAETLAAKTDEVVSQYVYLFEQ
mgnify:CR=1 FL=1